MPSPRSSPAFPVYRSYLPDGRGRPERGMRTRGPPPPRLDGAVGALLPLLLDAAEPSSACRFQQTSGMVMAKGVEDTAFYRYTRLGTLTEVGGDPTEFALAPAEFHPRMAPAPGRAAAVHDHAVHPRHQAQRGRPGTDLRARRARRPDWAQPCDRLQTLAPLPDGPLANLLWQAVVGRLAADRDRLQPTRRRPPGRPGTRPPGPTRTRTSRRSLHAAVDAAFDDPGGDRRTGVPRGPAGALRPAVQLAGAPSWSSSPCPGSRTSTRAPSSGTARWPTRTTGGRSTSAPAGAPLAALDAG